MKLFRGVFTSRAGNSYCVWNPIRGKIDMESDAISYALTNAPFFANKEWWGGRGPKNKLNKSLWVRRWETRVLASPPKGFLALQRALCKGADGFASTNKIRHDFFIGFGVTGLYCFFPLPHHFSPPSPYFPLPHHFFLSLTFPHPISPSLTARQPPIVI